MSYADGNQRDHDRAFSDPPPLPETDDKYDEERDMAVRYKVRGLAVVSESGALIYDFLDSQAEAHEICAILNDGIGPEWDVVRPELERRRQVAAEGLRPITAKVRIPNPVESPATAEIAFNFKRRHARLLLALKKIGELPDADRWKSVPFAKAAIDADEEEACVPPGS